MQSGAPAHSFAFTNKQIKMELGAPINEIFESFSKKPIASGSIAQVYKVIVSVFCNFCNESAACSILHDIDDDHLDSQWHLNFTV